MNNDLPGKHWFEGDELHIEVRGLRPPEPMVAILGQLDMRGQTGPVIVHHDREPIYLYPELVERHWTYEIVPADEGEVRLLLTLTKS